MKLLKLFSWPVLFYWFSVTGHFPKDNLEWKYSENFQANWSLPEIVSQRNILLNEFCSSVCYVKLIFSEHVCRSPREHGSYGYGSNRPEIFGDLEGSGNRPSEKEGQRIQCVDCVSGCLDCSPWCLDSLSGFLNCLSIYSDILSGWLSNPFVWLHTLLVLWCRKSAWLSVWLTWCLNSLYGLWRASVSFYRCLDSSSDGIDFSSVVYTFCRLIGLYLGSLITIESIQITNTEVIFQRFHY